MPFSIQQMHKAKSVPILEWLASKGHQYVKVSGVEYKFYSPFNPDENTPSFSANTLKNTFHDFSTGRKGDMIRLVSELENVDFITAVNRLLEFTGFEMMYEPVPMKEQPQGQAYSTIKKILPLESRNLIEYFQNRKIDAKIAKQWVNEVHYTNPKGSFYGAGFRNDDGGFEMRCPTRNGNVFKCFVGDVKSIRTFYTDDNETVSVFEGFTDFLSYLTYRKITKPFNTTIILNSTSLLTQETIKILSHFTVVESFLDNDKSGFEAFEKLEKYLPQDVILVNASQKLYPYHHDFNDFLRSQSL